MRAGCLIICGIALAQAISLAAPAALADPGAQPPPDVIVADATAAPKSDREDKNKVSEAAPKSDRATRAELNRSKSRLSDKPVPLLKEHTQLPERNPPIVEWNLPFLGPGNIISGFKIPTGAVWQPAFWMFGDFQTSAGVYNNGIDPGRQYLAARADIFGHLQLTPTERVVIGFTPLSQGENLGTGPLHVDGQGTRFVDAFNANIQSLFFEGDTRQLFPGIDPDDKLGLDYGFAVGKQQIFFQEGIMINDNIQALGITKDTIQIPGITQDMRVTGLFSWADIRRGDGVPTPDRTARLFGIFSETDTRKSVFTFDVAYVDSASRRDIFGIRTGGPGFYWGASATQRFGDINTAFRINTSTAIDGRGVSVDDGALFLAEISRTVPGKTDIFYADLFATAGHYTSAARSAQVPGPLERVGILFAPIVPGLAPSAVNADADHAFGGVLGYQMFFGPRRQLTMELGGKEVTNNEKLSVVALGAQYVQAITSRTSVQANAFVLDHPNGHFGYGAALGTTTRW